MGIIKWYTQLNHHDQHEKLEKFEKFELSRYELLQAKNNLLEQQRLYPTSTYGLLESSFNSKKYS